ncbi:MAG: ATP-binding protein, partial [Syntrophobacteraceae bacterium]|nr:ATP-binding protein [Syntrophobacteraceae bacterium]
LKISHACGNNLEMFSDPDFLSQVLENLLINSIESGGPGTEVHLEISSGDRETVMIQVTDNGAGIAPELLPDALFDPFITTKSKGTGVGLWQARKIVNHLGGGIAAENRPEGGARFCIHLSRYHDSQDMDRNGATTEVKV